MKFFLFAIAMFHSATSVVADDYDIAVQVLLNDGLEGDMLEMHCSAPERVFMQRAMNIDVPTDRRRQLKGPHRKLADCIALCRYIPAGYCFYRSEACRGYRRELFGLSSFGGGDNDLGDSFGDTAGGDSSLGGMFGGDAIGDSLGDSIGDATGGDSSLGGMLGGDAIGNGLGDSFGDNTGGDSSLGGFTQILTDPTDDSSSGLEAFIPDALTDLFGQLGDALSFDDQLDSVAAGLGDMATNDGQVSSLEDACELEIEKTRMVVNSLLSEDLSVACLNLLEQHTEYKCFHLEE